MKLYCIKQGKRMSPAYRLLRVNQDCARNVRGPHLTQNCAHCVITPYMTCRKNCCSWSKIAICARKRIPFLNSAWKTMLVHT